MAETATVTSKGQVTIPKEIRRALGVGAGDRLDFELEADGSVRVRGRRTDVRTLAGILHRPGKRALSVEEMNAAVARRFASRQ